MTSVLQLELDVPDVYITNYAIAHRMEGIADFKANINKRIVQFWAEINGTVPKLRIFQSARALRGHRNPWWNAEFFRALNSVMRQSFVDKLSFLELDEWLLTTELSNGDGWHFGGLNRKMETQIFLNMICNN